MEYLVEFLLASLLIGLIFISICIYKIVIKMTKIHNIISTNSMDLDRIKKVLIGEENSFREMKNKVDGIHTTISTQLVKRIMGGNKEK